MRIDSGFGAECHAFARRQGIDEGQHIVDQLRHTAAADIAHVKHVGPDMFEEWLTGFKRLLIAPDHDRQSTLLGADNAPTDRRIEHDHALFGQGRTDFLRRRRGVGTQVHINQSRPRRRDNAVLTEGDLLNFLRSRQRAKHNIARLRHRPRAVRRLRPQIDDTCEVVGADVIHQHVMTRLDEMPAHRRADIAYANKSQLHSASYIKFLSKGAEM